jgi:4-hydroxy-4-methyl-2-oxoglutarate aldolase
MALHEACDQQGEVDPAMRPVATAFTERCRPGDTLTLHAAVTYASPGGIIVADVGDFADAGHRGEFLTVAAMSRLIPSGCDRS